MRNTVLVLIGLIAIVVGAVMVFSRELTFRTREDVVKVGPLVVTADRDKSVALSPIIGGVAVAGGVLLVALGARKA